MKHLLSSFIFIVFLGITQCMAQELPDIETLRKDYILCVEDATLTEKYQEKLSTIKTLPPLYMGYLGALQSLEAKHAWSPYKKLALLNKAQETLKVAIKNEENNIEIRFLRFSMEHYIPAFLGQSKHLEEDRKAIHTNFNSTFSLRLPLNVRTSIAKFMLDSKRCTSEEEKVFSSFINSNPK